MSEAAAEVETKPCPSCAKPSAFEEIGSASKQRYYRCLRCGLWREGEKVATAGTPATLGSLGGHARMGGLSPEARSKLASEAATKRWQGEKLRENIVVAPSKKPA